MGKYDPLRKYLSDYRGEEVVLEFGKIAKLVGQLPVKADSDAWWTDDSGVQARAWHAAGWRVKSVDQNRKRVVFEREARVRKWATIAVAVLGAICAAAISVIGVTALPKWALFFVTFDITIALTAVTWALTNDKYRSFSLSVSTASLAVLLAGVATYHVLVRQTLPSATASFVRIKSAEPLIYGHSYQVLLRNVYLPSGDVLWVELATPLAEVGSTPQYSFFYTQASPELEPNSQYYLNVVPNNTAKLTEDVLTAFACPASDGQIVSGNASGSLRKITGCESLDYICIAELNKRPKYQKAPFTPRQCTRGRMAGLLMTNSTGT